MGRMGVAAAGKTIIEMTVAETATLFETAVDIDHVASYAASGESTAYAASIFNHANLTIARATLIFVNPNMPADRAFDILAHANLAADKTQSILYAMSLTAKLVDILTSGAGDLTVAGNTEISGVNRYETLTVNGGITLTLADQPSALIVDTIANSGNIVKKLSGGAAGTRAQPGAGRGGQGAGGFVVFADVLGSSGVISADGEVGENGTTVDVSGAGGDGGTGAFHRVGADVPGTGGSGSYNSTFPVSEGAGGVDGGGGGGIGNVEIGGDGGGSVLTTITYANMAVKVRQYAIDWVIVNVFGKAPTVTVSIDIYGSGGGGGCSYDTVGACGGGGGGGGEVLALCLTLNNTGTVRANAGAGGNGGTEGIRDNEGGGGGGGLVYLLYVALTAAGTLQANLAVAGAGDSNDIAGQAGGNGVATSQDVS